MQIANLTFARFLAALLVYFAHFQDYRTLSDCCGVYVANLAQNGFSGVTFFFILSGFVLSHVYLRALSEPSARGIVEFYLLRLARVLPIWLFLSAPFVLFAMRAGTSDHSSLFLFLAFLQAWSADVSTAFGHLGVAWTLSVEMFFYAVFPLIAFLVRPVYQRWPVQAGAWICMIGIAIPLAGYLYFVANGTLHLPSSDPDSAHRWLYRNPLMRLGDFLVGIGLYLVFLRARFEQRRSLGLRAIALGTAVLLPLMLALPLSPVAFDLAYIAPYGLIILGAAWIETGERPIAVRSKFALLLGESSFGLYLMHVAYGTTLFQPVRVMIGSDLFTSVWLLTFLIGASVGLYLIIEKPARASARVGIDVIGRWLDGRSTARSEPQPAQLRVSA